MSSDSKKARVDTDLVSFIEVHPESDVPIQNIPFGVFRPSPGSDARVGTAIGDQVRSAHSIECPPPPPQSCSPFRTRKRASSFLR